jgi:hypothetical protein
MIGGLKMQAVINKKEKIKVPNCFICMDTGIIIYPELTQFGYTANKVARCTCETGNQYVYDGKNCKQKSMYRIPLITETMDPLEIARNNLAKWYEENKNKEGFKEVWSNLKKKGRM